MDVISFTRSKKALDELSKIQSGTINVSTVGNTFTTTRVEFPKPFKTLPDVVITPHTATTGISAFAVSAIDLTGFTIGVTRNVTGPNTFFSWVAKSL